MKKVWEILRLMRPLNLLQGGIALLVTATLIDEFPGWRRILFAVGVVWAYTGAGNALNDYCDAEIDRVNRPGRPIPKGIISRQSALVTAIVLFGAGTLISIPVLTWELAGIMGFALFILISYSLYFKVRLFWGNLFVSLILGMAFLFAASAFGDIRKGVPPFFLAFGFNLIREIVKDVQDMKGDRLVKARTIPLICGVFRTRLLITAITVLLMLGALLPFLLNIYGNYYLLVLIFTVEILLGYFLYSLSQNSSAENCGRLAALLKADIFFGLLAIFLGRY